MALDRKKLVLRHSPLGWIHGCIWWWPGRQSRIWAFLLFSRLWSLGLPATHHRPRDHRIAYLLCCICVLHIIHFCSYQFFLQLFQYFTDTQLKLLKITYFTRPVDSKTSRRNDHDEPEDPWGLEVGSSFSDVLYRQVAFYTIIQWKGH